MPASKAKGLFDDNGLPIRGQNKTIFWYVQTKGKESKPLELKQLLDRAHRGKLNGDTLLRRDRGDWVIASEDSELMRLLLAFETADVCERTEESETATPTAQALQDLGGRVLISNPIDGIKVSGLILFLSMAIPGFILLIGWIVESMGGVAWSNGGSGWFFVPLAIVGFVVVLAGPLSLYVFCSSMIELFYRLAPRTVSVVYGIVTALLGIVLGLFSFANHAIAREDGSISVGERILTMSFLVAALVCCTVTYRSLRDAMRS